MKILKVTATTEVRVPPAPEPAVEQRHIVATLTVRCSVDELERLMSYWVEKRPVSVFYTRTEQ